MGIFNSKSDSPSNANSAARPQTGHLNLITPKVIPKSPGTQPLTRFSSTPNLLSCSGPQTVRPFVRIGAAKVQVIVDKGQVSDEQVDVIVCGVPGDLDLSKARGSKKLLQVAGQSIQSECRKTYPRGINVGDVAETRGGNLNCSKVYFVTLPNSQKDGSQNQVVIDIVKKCLEMANRRYHSSIAFSDIGTSMHFPSKILADLMFKGITEFSDSNSQPSVSKVVLSIYNKHVFEDFRNKARLLSVVAKVSHCQVGNIKVDMKVGQLIDQQVDVIVCNGSKDLNMKNGGMAQAVSDAAGPQMQQELNTKYPGGIQHGDLAISQGHKLKCQYVYHLSLPDWNTSSSITPQEYLESSVMKCLEEANKYPTTTRRIAFPTLGTGALNYPPSVVAQTMAKCIQDFDNKYPNTQLTYITIVAYSLSNNWKTLETEFMKELLALSGAVKKSLHQHVHNNQTGNRINCNVIKNPTTKADYGNLYKQEQRTPSYWTKFDNSKTLKDWCLVPGVKPQLVNLGQKDTEYIAVEDLMLSTWQTKYVGHGRDAKGLDQLGYTNIEVTKIQRFESPVLYETYSQCRASLFWKASTVGPFKTLGSLNQNKKGEILTANVKSALKKDMYPGVNEYYLFHGTTDDKLKVILEQGLDPRLATTPCFGKGVYCAESSTKSDQYADYANQRCKVKEKKMILTRMSLGEIFVRNDTDTVKDYSRAPCKVCFEDKCTETSHSKRGLFDSIVVDGKWNFREFIVYDRKACYPEYVIHYKRI